MTSSDAYCGSQVDLSITVSPPLAIITIDSSLKSIKIAKTTNQDHTGIYTVTISAKFNDIEMTSKDFTVTVFSCEEDTIEIADKFKNTPAPYNLGDTKQEIISWMNSDVTHEPLCGDIKWSATKSGGVELWSKFSTQLDSEPFSLSIETSNPSDLRSWTYRIRAEYALYPGIGSQTKREIEVTTDCTATIV